MKRERCCSSEAPHVGFPDDGVGAQLKRQSAIKERRELAGCFPDDGVGAQLKLHDRVLVARGSIEARRSSA